MQLIIVVGDESGKKSPRKSGNKLDEHDGHVAVITNRSNAAIPDSDLQSQLIPRAK